MSGNTRCWLTRHGSIQVSLLSSSQAIKYLIYSVLFYYQEFSSEESKSNKLELLSGGALQAGKVRKPNGKAGNQ